MCRTLTQPDQQVLEVASMSLRNNFHPPVDQIFSVATEPQIERLSAGEGTVSDPLNLAGYQRCHAPSFALAHANMLTQISPRGWYHRGTRRRFYHALSPARPPMPRRFLIPLLIALLLIATVTVLPLTTPGRNWLVARVVAAADLGYQVTVASSRGNSWRQLTLEGVTLDGPGVSLTVREASFGYFLPSLLVGELPLSLSLAGVRGSLRLDDLAVPETGPAGPPIRVDLRAFDLTDVSVDLGSAAYRLPELTFSDVTATSAPSGLMVAATVATSEGQAKVAGSVRLGPFSADLEVLDADATLARHWWAPLRTGRVRGSVTVRDREIEAELEVTGATFELAELEFSDVGGRVHYRNLAVAAELQGQTLGGPVSASGTVDIAARHWQAQYLGTPDLTAATAWIVGRLDRRLPNLTVAGSATVAGEAEGWTTVAASGTVNLSGSIDAVRIDDVAGNFGIEPGGAVEVVARGEVAGGHVTATVSAAAGGLDLAMDGTGIRFERESMTSVAQATIQLSGRDGVFRGAFTGGAVGEAAGNTFALDIDGVVDEDGWQGFVTAGDVAGAPITGAAVLQNGHLTGRLVFDRLDLPYLDVPVSLGISVDGPLEALPVAIDLGATTPVGLALGEVRLDADLRGSLEAILVETRLDGIEGRFGPFSIAGSADLATQTFAATVSTEAVVAHSGSIRATASLPAGQLRFDNEGLVATGQLRIDSADMGGAAMGPLEFAAEWRRQTGLTLNSDAARVQLQLGTGAASARFSTNVTDLPITFRGQRLAASGALSGNLSSVLTTLEGAVQIDADLGTARLEAARGEVRVDATLVPGLEVAGAIIDDPIDIVGQVDIASLEAQAVATAGDIILALSGTIEPGSRVHGELTTGTLQSLIEVDPWALAGRVEGLIDLAPIGRLFGLDLAGRLAGTMAVAADSFRGELTGSLAQPLPTAVMLTGSGPDLVAELSTMVFDQPVTLKGTVYPERNMTADLGTYGTLQLEGDRIVGSGSVPELEVWEFRLWEQAWAASGDLTARKVTISSGASTAVVGLDAAIWYLALDLEVPAMFQHRDAVLGLEASFDATDPHGTIAGSLAFADASDQISFRGSVQQLEVEGSVEASTVGGLLTSSIVPVGRLDFSGTVQPFEGPGLDLTGGWTAGDRQLAVAVRGQPHDLRLTAFADDVSLTWSGERTELTAIDFDPGAFFLDLPATARLNGHLEVDDETGWQGDLGIVVDEPLAAAIQLTGRGDTLVTRTTIPDPQISASFSGEVWPSLNLEGSLDPFQGSLPLSARIVGTVTDPVLSAELLTAPRTVGDLVEIPSLAARATIDLRDFSVALTGPGLDIAVENGSMSGEATFAFALADEQHAATVAVDGPVASPRVVAHVAGPVVSGQGDFIGGTLSFDFQADPLSLGVDVEPVHLSRMSITGQSDLAGQWQATIAAEADYRGYWVPVVATASGSGLSYTGSLTLAGLDPANGRPLAMAGFGGTAADATIEMDLAEVDLTQVLGLFDIDLPATAEGNLTATTMPFSYQLSGSGLTTVRDIPVRFTVAAGSGREAEVEVDLLGVNGRATGIGPAGVDLAVSAQGAALDGRLSFGQALELNLSGQVAARPTTVLARYDLADASGDLELEFGASTLAGALRGPPQSLEFDGTVTISEPAVVPLGLEGRLLLRSDTKTVSVETVLNLLDAPFTGTVSLAGPLFPTPSLVGSFQAAQPIGSGELAVRRAADGADFLISAVQEALSLTAWVGTDGTLHQVALEGEGELSAAGQTIGIQDAAMTWAPTIGFGGRAQATATIEGIAAVATVRGSHGLAVDVEARGPWKSRLAGQVTLSSTPWSDPVLGGSLTLSAPALVLADMLQLPSIAESVFSAEVSVAGTFMEPQLSGPASVRGPVEAEGSVSLSTAGAEVELVGTNFGVQGVLTPGGWDAQVDVREYPVAAIIPWISAPLLSAEGSASGDWRGNIAIVAPMVALTSTQSQATGQATAVLGSEGSTLTAAVRLDGELADLDIGRNLQGRVRGTVAWSGNMLATDQYQVSGLLALTDVSFVDDGGPFDAARLGGSVQLSGTTADPVITLSLLGEGAAGGTLRGELRPLSQQAQLLSTLTLGSWATDLDIGVTPTDLQVDGRAGWQDLTVILTTAEAGVELVGGGRLAGWTADFDRSNLTVRAEGPLGLLIPATEGHIALSVGIDPKRPTQPSLSGVLDDLTFAGIPLGDLEINAPNARDEVELVGQRLRARVRLNDDLRWNLDLDGVALTEDLGVTATGAGRGSRGRLRAVVSGRVLGQPLTLPTDVDIGDGFRFRSQSELLGGTADLEAMLVVGEGWRGSIRADGLQIGPATVGLEGTVSGSPTVPTLNISTALSGPFEARGEARLSLVDVWVDQLVNPPSSPSDIHVVGSAWPGIDLTVSGPDTDEQLILTSAATLGDDRLTATGSLSLALGPADLSVQANSERFILTADLERSAGIPGLAFSADVNPDSVTNLTSHIWQRGLSFQGTEKTRGTIVVGLNPLRFAVTDMFYAAGAVELELQGTVTPGQTSHLTGTVRLDSSTEMVRDIVGDRLFPFEIDGLDSVWFLRSNLQEGRVFAEWRPSISEVRLRTDLALNEGSLAADLRLAAGKLSGTLDLDAILVPGILGLPAAELGGHLEVVDNRIRGGVTALASTGSVQLDGTWALGTTDGPRPTFPLRTLDVNARLRTIDVTSLPVVQRWAPHLSGQVSGVLQLRDGLLVGRVVAPNLEAAGTTLPLDAEFNGPLGAIEVRANLDGSILSGSVLTDSIQGVVRLERFPLHALAGIVTGETDVSAEVSGALRIDLPYANPGLAEVRLATELIRLERGSVVTTGNTILDYFEGSLVLKEAVFVGAGSWQASGRIQAGDITFNLTANDADYGPLLGLIPSLAALDIGTRGNLQIVASGDLSNPLVEARSATLDFSVAGSHFRLEDASATLAGTTLDFTTNLVGVEPFSGRVAVEGRGTIGLGASTVSGATFRFMGDANLPIVGDITNLDGALTVGDGVATLDSIGRSGGPFQLHGTLSPLDLSLTGEDLTLHIPSVLLASAIVDADVQLHRSDNYLISGRLVANEARFQLGIREPPDPTRGNAPPFERIVFNDIVIDAPQQLSFNESFGSAEGQADLILGGTLAAPELTGVATTVRGTLRFAGRDFAIEEATASFDPTRGTFPRIDLVASTAFEKSRVVTSGAGVRFVEPRNSNRLDVTLRFSGEIMPTTGGSGFSLDFDPELSSNGLIVVDGEALLATGPRALTESELLSLVTLGRLDFSTDTASGGALATAVAQSAIDTAVDLLILNDLQTAIGEALGVDVVEIRTTAVSNILEGTGNDPFSVSLQLGGYLTDEVFASYQIGSFDDENAAFALTNEVRFIYALGPVGFDLAGHVDFESSDVLALVPGLRTSVRYSFSPLFGLEAGVDLSGTRSLIRFGAAWRW